MPLPMEPEPFYKKSALILLGLTLAVYILFMLSDILIPLAFAGLISILLNSVHNRFMHYKIPKVPSIVLTLFITILFFEFNFSAETPDLPFVPLGYLVAE
jgi:predicted PurR-regulated permease PerM